MMQKEVKVRFLARRSLHTQESYALQNNPEAPGKFEVPSASPPTGLKHNRFDWNSGLRFAKKLAAQSV